MNQKNQSGNVEDFDADELAAPWSENISYEGFLKLGCFTFRPEMFLSLTGTETKLILYLTFLRWRFAEHTGRLRLAVQYLVNGTGFSEKTIRRCMKSLEKKQYLRCLLIDRHHKGNHYLIHSVLLLDSAAPNPSGQKDRTKVWSGQKDRAVRSKRPDDGSAQAHPSGQKDHQDHIQTSSESGATCHSPNRGSQGGENGPAGKEERSPNGHDQNQKQETKGVGPEADPLQTQLQRCQIARERNGMGKQPSLE